MFFLSKPKIRAKLTSKFLNTLPKDGVMADGPIAYYLAYQTDKRVVIIPHERGDDIGQTMLSIKEFKLSYAVISKKHTDFYHPPATEFIKQWKLIITIWEDEDFYTIYEIPQVDEAHQNTAEDKSYLHWAGQTRRYQPLSFIELCWN